MRSRASTTHDVAKLPLAARRYARGAPLGRAARATVRRAAGCAFVLHGLAHAVLPARGASAIESTALGRGAMHTLCTVAMAGFVAAGVGVLGTRPFHRVVRPLTYLAAAASALAIIAFGKIDLSWGIALDTVMVITLPSLLELLPSGVGARSAFRRAMSLVGSSLGVAFVGYVLLTAATRPWRNAWGVRADELTRPLPGDWVGRDPAFECTHAVSINAPPEAVWPWLVQIGQDRGGFYSYDLLERVFLLRIHNADAIHPEWQTRQVGDLVRAAPPDWLGGIAGDQVGWRVGFVEPNRALVLRYWGAFVLAPEPDGTTRLIVRSKVGDPDYPVWAIVPSFLLFDLPHFIMERKMLLGIRERAELAHHR